MEEQVRFIAIWITLVLFVVVGHRRRRRVWTPGSWRRFAVLVITFVLLIAVALAMASAVDRGVKAKLPSWTHATYTWIVIVLALLGPMGLAGFLAWFALGEPEQQLRFRREAQRE